MIRRPPRSTQSRSSAASDVYKRQIFLKHVGLLFEFGVRCTLFRLNLALLKLVAAVVVTGSPFLLANPTEIKSAPDGCPACHVVAALVLLDCNSALGTGC
eukprot:TRINITY_DN11655_c0_g1_i2.p2 TRINITY_DN11655_c0_g1~~TRINITY_DN11655_c0_g1_i2.p2  ORF type:complete len:100 (+),score=30.30 TRINITY_DN11655_c0_g1_i2:106-405(+)